MINSPLSSWSCILPFHCELINQTISLNIIQFYTCNSTLINTNTSYLTRRYECYRNDWYLHRYRDAWCINIVILLWRLPLLCSESAMCYWHYSTMYIWWYQFYCQCEHNLLANHKHPIFLPSHSKEVLRDNNCPPLLPTISQLVSAEWPRLQPYCLSASF